MKTVPKRLLHGELDLDCCVVKEDWIDVPIVMYSTADGIIYAFSSPWRAYPWRSSFYDYHADEFLTHWR